MKALHFAATLSLFGIGTAAGCSSSGDVANPDPRPLPSLLEADDSPDNDQQPLLNDQQPPENDQQAALNGQAPIPDCETLCDHVRSCIDDCGQICDALTGFRDACPEQTDRWIRCALTVTEDELCQSEFEAQRCADLLRELDVCFEESIRREIDVNPDVPSSEPQPSSPRPFDAGVAI